MEMVCLDFDAVATDCASPGDRNLATRLELTTRLLSAENLALSVCQVAQSRSAHTALVWRSQSLSYDWILTIADFVRNYLIAHPKFCPGARVVIAIENSAEYLAAFYGVLLADGVAVPVAPSLERERLEEIYHSCSPVILLTRSQERLSKSLQATHQFKVLSLGQATAQSPTQLGVDRAVTKRGGHDLAVIMYTSGSTGRPKGVMLSHRNLLSNARSILAYLPVRDDDRALVVLPFYHAFGNSILQTHLLAGATLILDGSLAVPATVTQALLDRQATSFSAVPEVYTLLTRFAAWECGSLPHLRYMSVAGGSLRADLADDLSQRIAPAELYVMYGQTEATARLAYLPPNARRSHRGSIGKAIPGVELRVVDEQGVEAAVGKIGMLQARGESIMLGYWGDPQGTAEVLQNDWLSTGDLATVDQSGFIYLKGRANRLIKVQGNRVHPAEIEDVVAHHFPGTHVVVFPYEAENLTRLALFCAPSGNVPVNDRDIHQVCVRQLPYYKVPQYIEVLDRLPLNGSLKVDRVQLARRITSQN